MKNKQHGYILKAFVESSIPMVIYRRAPELVAIDSFMGGACTQLIKGAKSVNLPSNIIITKKEKDVFSELINQVAGMEKTELVLYYRLALLTEAVLLQYRQ